MENGVFLLAKYPPVAILETRNNSGESHTQLKGAWSDTHGVHRIFWNGHLACLARTFTCSGSSIGYARRHHNHSTLRGGSPPAASPTTNSAPLRPLPKLYYLVMIEKTRKRLRGVSHPYHSTDDKSTTREGAEFLSDCPLTGISTRPPFLSSVNYVRIGRIYWRYRCEWGAKRA